MSNTRTNTRSPFWAFQIVGWSLLFLATLGINLLRGNDHWSTFVLALVLASGGFISTSLFRQYIRRKDYNTASIRGLILPLLIGSLIASLLWSAPLLLTQYLIEHHVAGQTLGFGMSTVWLTAINNYFVVLLWAIIYFAWHYFRLAQTARLERYRSEMAVRDAQLNTLKGQINPHFMFNALNNIRALMLEDIPRSREMITKLADLLRYSMNMSEQREVSVAEELTVVNDFFELCKIQFEDKLHYDIRVSPEAKHCVIPPMIIQILVENSVKHGVSSSSRGGKVEVDVLIAGAFLVIEVCNTGSWQPSNAERRESNGIGLPNVRRRLRLLYGESAQLHLRVEENNIIARIQIPHQHGQN